MAIIERVRLTTDFPENQTLRASDTAATLTCADCGVTAPQAMRAVWGFERSRDVVRRSCPECVCVALPSIETCIDCP